MKQVARAAIAACLFAGLAGFPAWSAPLCPGISGVQRAPRDLQARIAQAFAIAPQGAANSVIRCDGETLMACVAGANLNCGPADTRGELPGATDYCKANPDSDFIPMFATGHATIYAWRCSGGRAIAGKVVAPVDSAGYDSGNWKPLR